MSRHAAARMLMIKAERACEGARLLFEDGDADGACSRAYYAIFNAANAALRMVGVDTAQIKTHSGLLTVFSRELVLTGKVEPGQSKVIAEVQFLRQLADYSDTPPNLDNTKLAIEKAGAFLHAVQTVFPQLGVD